MYLLYWWLYKNDTLFMFNFYVNSVNFNWIRVDLVETLGTHDIDLWMIKNNYGFTPDDGSEI